MKVGPFLQNLTKEPAHLCKPDAILDGPGPRVPVVLVLRVPPLGQEEHWVSILLARQPESILVYKQIVEGFPFEILNFLTCDAYMVKMS